jgi:hypothetical protein
VTGAIYDIYVEHFVKRMSSRKSDSSSDSSDSSSSFSIKNAKETSVHVISYNYIYNI